MSSLDIRTHDEEDFIDTIQFSDDESLYCVDGDGDLFYIKSEGKDVPIYLDSIPDLILALDKAQELWN